MTDFKKGLLGGVPIALGYLSVSFAFGLRAVSLGLTLWQAVLISLANLTSAGQFAGLGIMAGGGGMWIEMACTQFIINLRYALMSLSLSQRTARDVCGPHRWLIGFGITDEIFAVAMKSDGEVTRRFMYGLILLPLVGWTGGTFLGAAAGSILPETVSSALGAAIYAMFLAIMIPSARKSSAVLKVVLFSAALSCAFRFLPIANRVSGGFAVIICTVVSAAAGAVLFPVGREESAQ